MTIDKKEVKRIIQTVSSFPSFSIFIFVLTTYTILKILRFESSLFTGFSTDFSSFYYFCNELLEVFAYFKQDMWGDDLVKTLLQS